MEECQRDDPGKEMVLHRLLEVLLVEALRWRGIGSDVAGLLSGMRDPLLARVLRTMHADVRASWTVAKLAKIAGLSRSAFAARFGEVLGCGPIEYLAFAQPAMTTKETDVAAAVWAAVHDTTGRLHSLPAGTRQPWRTPPEAHENLR